MSLYHIYIYIYVHVRIITCTIHIVTCIPIYLKLYRKSEILVCLERVCGPKGILKHQRPSYHKTYVEGEIEEYSEQHRLCRIEPLTSDFWVSLHISTRNLKLYRKSEFRESLRKRRCCSVCFSISPSAYIIFDVTYGVRFRIYRP